jgi:cob(I)alamin adenosyltransferase
MKIYTRKGDSGETSLADGSRLPKDAPRVAAYGDVDELNAVLGVVRAHARGRDLRALLDDIQRDLFAVGAQLAASRHGEGSRKTKAAVMPAQVHRLERAIDAHEAMLPPLAAFVLPGGSRLGSFLHLARTVCRRAERSIVALSRAQRVEPRVVAYVNRLSDLLFVLARYADKRSGRRDERW